VSEFVDKALLKTWPEATSDPTAAPDNEPAEELVLCRMPIPIDAGDEMNVPTHVCA